MAGGAGGGRNGRLIWRHVESHDSVSRTTSRVESAMPLYVVNANGLPVSRETGTASRAGRA